MLKPEYHNIAGYEVLEIQTAEAYRPYDRLILRDSKCRAIWTVLNCEPAHQERPSPGYAEKIEIVISGLPALRRASSATG